MRRYDLHVEIGVPFKHSANFHGDQQHILFRHTIFIGENPPTNSCPIEMTSKLSLVGVMLDFYQKSPRRCDFRILSPKKRHPKAACPEKVSREMLCQARRTAHESLGIGSDAAFNLDEVRECHKQKMAYY